MTGYIQVSWWKCNLCWNVGSTQLIFPSNKSNHFLVVTHIFTIKFGWSFHIRAIGLYEQWLLVGVQLMVILIKHLLDVGNNILYVMVSIYIPTMLLILIGIRVLELVNLGSEVYTQWAIIILRFLSLFKVYNPLTASMMHLSLQESNRKQTI